MDSYLQNNFQPKNLAKICGININTLNGYLRDTELFPPAKKDDDTGYRYYSQETIVTLSLFKRLKKKPFRLIYMEIKSILVKMDAETQKRLDTGSNDVMLMYLKDQGKFF